GEIHADTSASQTQLGQQPGGKTQAYLTQRFQGDGVRYKAKLIGVDEVPGPQGDKMSLDSMMKLKGQELAGRQRGLHKQRVWLKVSDTCVQIIDERRLCVYIRIC
uniref:PID domain-containing protein n=1 Tax=Scleropages formosus TaxID=113540 RepID=A0A8C9S8M0_SCLFO